MRRFGRLGLIWAGLSLAILFAGSVARAQDTQNFRVNSFTADYYLDRDAQKTSTLKTVETIVAEFPNYDQNHGILRAIPQSYRGHPLSLQIDSVTGPDGKLTYKTSRQNDNLVLKIGDPNIFVHSQQTYVISYTMRNVTAFFNDHEEFYWNVNGDQWSQSFDNVIARLHLPKTITMDRQPICYAGYPGNKDPGTCSITTDGNLVTAATTHVSAGQTLTIVAGFAKGTFVPGPEIARAQLVEKIKIIAELVALTGPPLIALVFMFNRWRKFGNDPKGRGIIIPEYEPPKDFTVLSSGYLLKQKLQPVAFSAALVELAVKRYLTIYEIPKKGLFGKADYELEVAKPTDDLPPELKKVFEIVFEHWSVGSRIKVSEIKKSASDGHLKEAMDKLEDSLSLTLFGRAYFSNDPDKTRSKYRLWSTILFFAGFFGAFVVPGGPFSFVLAGSGFAGLVVFGFSFIMPARTKLGIETHDALLGLKDYIKMAEADRIKFLQSPAGAEKIQTGSYDPSDPKLKVKLFENLLPYAVLFGLEKDWAKQFKDIYTTAPNWYQGNWATFNAIYLVSSLSSFSSISSTTFATTSASSGSGFGGGFAGGGGGGGGGGGW